MSDAIGVLIVEREPLFRRGLVSCVKGARGVRVADSVGTADEALRRADELLPSVALVGTTLPDAPGIAAAADLRRVFPALAVVVLADSASDDELFAAIRAGAFAYLSKDVVERELVGIIKRAAAGEYVINEQLLAKPAVAARVIEQFREAAGDLAPARAFAPLTFRERQILQGVAFGQTSAQIGTGLGISGQTVKNHVTSVMRKLAVNDRTQAVVLALRRGWLLVEIPAAMAHAVGRRPRTVAAVQPADGDPPTEPAPDHPLDGSQVEPVSRHDDDGQAAAAPERDQAAAGPDDAQPGAASDAIGFGDGRDGDDVGDGVLADVDPMVATRTAGDESEGPDAAPNGDATGEEVGSPSEVLSAPPADAPGQSQAGTQGTAPRSRKRARR